MKQRLLSLALAGLLCLCLAPAAAAAGGYSDVPEGHWAEESIRRATELGLFHGNGKGEFGLGKPISRAEFVTVLGRFFGWEEVRPARASYSDVASGSWYFGAVETARAHGAVDNAYRTFRPDDGLARGEMASMLVRSLGYTYLAGAAADYASPFTDVSVNRGFITVAYDLGLMDGKGGGRFDPDASATREQAAAVLVRLYDQMHAPSARLSSARGFRLVTAATPMASQGDEMPITPLEPLADLYAALRRLKSGGADFSRVALRLTAGGVQTVAGSGVFSASTTLSAAEVEEVLAREGVNTFYSDQYESAYCIYQLNAYQTAYLWYQSERSMAAKLQLARLFGVTRYILE